VSSVRAKKAIGSLAFVGAGPGDPRLLTLRGADLLATADVVLSDVDVDRSLCRPDVHIAPASAREAAAAVRAGKRVVWLMAGDPATSAADELEAAARAKLPFEVVPGVSAALAVPAYAGLPVLHSKLAGEVRVVDLQRGRHDWTLLAAGRSTLVLLGDHTLVAAAAAALVEHGRAADTSIAVTASGSTTAQQTVVATLGSVAAEVAGLPGSLVAVVGDVVRLREKLSWYESKPLFGWQVLVPRTREQAAWLSDQLRSYGAVPVEVPTIAVEPPRTPAPMDRAIKGLVSGRYQWIVFTSTNAVRAVREKFEEVGLDSRAFAGIKVACVGEQTAAAIRAWGISPELVPSGEQSSEGLLADFPAYDDVFDPIDRVLLPRADIATETLVQGLKDLGWNCDDVTAYRTVRAAPPPAPIRDAIKGGGFDAVLFTSSSTVRNLVGIAGKPHPSTVIAAIGPQTAKAAQELGLRVDVLSPTPSVAALAEALAEFGLARRAAGEPPRPGARAPKPNRPSARKAR
jgi:uroporphyrinogen III methyltransferase/synthase